ncbi:unnamed protein product, partial [marine sediment metagenome]
LINPCKSIPIMVLGNVFTIFDTYSKEISLHRGASIRISGGDVRISSGISSRILRIKQYTL